MTHQCSITEHCPTPPVLFNLFTQPFIPDSFLTSLNMLLHVSNGKHISLDGPKSLMKVAVDLMIRKYYDVMRRLFVIAEQVSGLCNENLDLFVADNTVLCCVSEESRTCSTSVQLDTISQTAEVQPAQGFYILLKQMLSVCTFRIWIEL